MKDVSDTMIKKNTTYHNVGLTSSHNFRIGEAGEIQKGDFLGHQTANSALFLGQQGRNT
jgi:hypothetical protein